MELVRFSWFLYVAVFAVIRKIGGSSVFGVLRVGVVAAVCLIDAVSRNHLFVWMIETVHLVVLVYLCQSFETLVQKERIT